jgi:hypothetical protein
MAGKIISQKLLRRETRYTRITIELQGTYPHLRIDKIETEHVRQEEDNLVLGIVTLRCSNIRPDASDFLKFP